MVAVKSQLPCSYSPVCLTGVSWRHAVSKVNFRVLALGLEIWVDVAQTAKDQLDESGP